VGPIPILRLETHHDGSNVVVIACPIYVSCSKRAIPAPVSQTLLAMLQKVLCLTFCSWSSLMVKRVLRGRCYSTEVIQKHNEILICWKKYSASDDCWEPAMKIRQNHCNLECDYESRQLLFLLLWWHNNDLGGNDATPIAFWAPSHGIIVIFMLILEHCWLLPLG
jgi:hypothetical protein